MIKNPKTTRQARNFHNELYAGVPGGSAQNSSGAGATLEGWKTLTLPNNK